MCKHMGGFSGKTDSLAEQNDSLHWNTSCLQSNGSTRGSAQCRARPPSARACAQGRGGNARWDPTAACQGRLPAMWAGIVAGHALCVLRGQTGQRQEAYQALQAVVSPFVKARYTAAPPDASSSMTSECL